VVTTQRSRFEILPAIDLVGGMVVRLRQGDFAREDLFSDEPVTVATGFSAAGARWLHIVDLDGAREGYPVQTAAIARILDAVVGADVACEVAGGLRTEPAVDAALTAGASRLVLGTAALGDLAMVARLVRRHGSDRIAAAIDVRSGVALGDGWRVGARGTSVAVAVHRLVDAGVELFETTAIERDGLLAGPDVELLAGVVAIGVDVIASGGIRSVADLHDVRAAGCVGAIVGRALYDGSLELREALAEAG
jgi:phosphoribosylformimino-5-aminoimidazole carboxamide ribotide isomerase